MMNLDVSLVMPLTISLSLGALYVLLYAFAQNDVLMNLNASARPNAERVGAENVNETRSSRVAKERGSFVGEKLGLGEATTGLMAAVIHDASFTVELRGGPGRGTKAICRSLYCRIVHIPGPNFVDRDKIIFGTSERSDCADRERANQPADHIAHLPPALVYTMPRQYGAGE